jgi:hypothetical protein
MTVFLVLTAFLAAMLTPQLYSAFAANYTNCTESAIEAIDRYMREGEALTRDIVARYGAEYRGLVNYYLDKIGIDTNVPWTTQTPWVWAALVSGGVVAIALVGGWTTYVLLGVAILVLIAFTTRRPRRLLQRDTTVSTVE